MRVIVAFDDLTTGEASDLGDAFWLVDTPANRKLAEAAWATKRYDGNSAVFNRPVGIIGVPEVEGVMDDIVLHHPQWREIVFKGFVLTTELEVTLGSRGDVAKLGTKEFVLRR